MAQLAYGRAANLGRDRRSKGWRGGVLRVWSVWRTGQAGWGRGDEWRTGDKAVGGVKWADYRGLACRQEPAGAGWVQHWESG